MDRIVKRSKYQPCPKLFQNCRSTRETELFKITGGNVKAVCSWIGNSPAVAMQHYAQVTEADLQEAAKMSVLDDAEKTVQNSVLIAAELGRTEPHENSNDTDLSPYYCESKDNYATLCESVQNGGKWAIQDSNKKSQRLSNKAFNKTTKSSTVQNSVHFGRFSPDLAKIITVWSNLPEHIKKTIITLIQSCH